MNTEKTSVIQKEGEGVDEKKNNVKRNCANCGNFAQHYGKVDLNISPVNCGHCLVTGKKRAKPDDGRRGRCPEWVPKEIRAEEDGQAVLIYNSLPKREVKYRLNNIFKEISEIYEFITH